MPFKETCVEEETMRFIAACLKNEANMTQRCEEFGISRQWGYELVKRFRARGPAGLVPLSCAPHRHGRAMPAAVAAAILRLRCEWPTWGPKKLRAVLAARHPGVDWPAHSTIGDLLRREGLSQPRKNRPRAVPASEPFAPVRAPNDLWCIDFKGWFRTRDGQRCDPLTLTDADSRFLLACRIVEPTAEGVHPVVERIMREHGLPQAIRSDNGSPFASTGAGGLTTLAVHWVKLGIRLERTDPGSPQQNGRHERMHGTLKKETANPPADTPAAQQAALDRFHYTFNHVRPHEALGQKTPASRYTASARPYPDRIEEPPYDAEHAVRRVRTNGTIKWGGEMVFISEALIGEPVGIAETLTGDWIVRFADIRLGYIDRGTKKLRRFAPARPGRRKAHREQAENTVNDVSGQ
ncbi:MAG TPA: IS481 family transposase [Sphingomicrobium sp.]|jgi:transposase InsO family protein|nr:IS481 family transposase [Sphingomicrobium sp.]